MYWLIYEEWIMRWVVFKGIFKLYWFFFLKKKIKWEGKRGEKNMKSKLRGGADKKNTGEEVGGNDSWVH